MSWWKWEEEPDPKKRKELVRSDLERKRLVRPGGDSREESSDWEGQLGKASMGAQYATGIILTAILIGFGLILTRGMLADPALINPRYGMGADMMILAVWAGILVPLSALWGAIYESRKNKMASGLRMPLAGRVRDYWRGRASEPPDSGTSYETTSSEATDQVLETENAQRQESKPEDADFSYRGELPKRKRKGYDY